MVYDTVNLNNNNMNDVINDFETFFVKILSHFDDMAASPPPPDTEMISSALEALNWTCKVISAKPKRFFAKMVYFPGNKELPIFWANSWMSLHRGLGLEAFEFELL